MNAASHSIEIPAPVVGRRHGTTKSLRTLIVDQLDDQLIETQDGVLTKEARKSHGAKVKSVTVTFHYEQEDGDGK